MKLIRNLLSLRIPLKPSRPKNLTLICTDQPIEEEKFNRGSQSHYYPVRIGDTLNNKYQIISKLGYGTSSTVWLVRDRQK